MSKNEVIGDKSQSFRAGIQARMKSYFVYIMASQRNGTLYIGVTNDLLRRVYEHKNHLMQGFTQDHRVHTLVWYEEGTSIEAAIQREKQIKKWNRVWKLRLIESINPQWKDLSMDMLGKPGFPPSRE